MKFYVQNDRYGLATVPLALEAAEKHRDELQRLGDYGRVWIVDEDGKEVPQMPPEAVSFARHQLIRRPGENFVYQFTPPSPVVPLASPVSPVQKVNVYTLVFNQHQYYDGHDYRWMACDQYGREVWREGELPGVIAACRGSLPGIARP